MPRTKKQKILRFFVYPVMGLAVVAFLSYALIIRPLQIRNQKQQFEKAEASLDTLATQIEQTIGKPDDTKKEKTCDRPNLKSGKGPLSCDVSLYLLYKNRGFVESNSLMKKISAFSDASLRIGSGSAKGSAFVNKSQARGDQTFFQSFESLSNLSCAFSYTYPSTERKIFRITDDENLVVGMGCGGSTKSELFPLKD